MSELPIKKWQVDIQDIHLKCFWLPGRWMDNVQLEELEELINRVNNEDKPVKYGFFDPEFSLLKKRMFMSQSLWCVVFKKNRPFGFVYQYLLGKHENTNVVHLGLVKFSHHPGKSFIRLPYAALGLGNIINFGPYLATNVTHLPVIVDMFADIAREVYPHYEHQDSALRAKYRPILKLLNQNYLQPILGYDAEAVDQRRFVIKDSMVEADSAFDTNWQSIPKSSKTLCNVFVKEWLGLKGEEGEQVHSDIVQVGMVDYRYLTAPQAAETMNMLKFVELNDIGGKGQLGVLTDWFIKKGA